MTTVGPYPTPAGISLFHLELTRRYRGINYSVEWLLIVSTRAYTTIGAQSGNPILDFTTLLRCR